MLENKDLRIFQNKYLDQKLKSDEFKNEINEYIKKINKCNEILTKFKFDILSKNIKFTLEIYVKSQNMTFM